MIKEIQRFEHKREAHSKRIRSTCLEEQRLSQIYSQQRDSQLESMGDEQILLYIAQRVKQNQTLNRSEGKHFWGRLLDLKERYQNCINSKTFLALSYLTGLQIDSRTYTVLKNRGWKKFKVQEFEIVKSWKVRKGFHAHSKCYRTYYPTSAKKYIRLKRDGQTIAQFDNPEQYEILRMVTYEQTLQKGLKELIELLSKAVLSKDAQE